VGDSLGLVSDGGVFTRPHMTWPVGELSAASLQEIVDAAWLLFRERGWPLRILYIDENALPLLRCLSGYQIQLTCDHDFDDYLYDAAALRDLSGKTLHGQRNHFNRFRRACNLYEYRPISAADRDEALGLVKAWCDERALDCRDMTQSDYMAIRQVFADFDALDVRGGSIRIGGRLVAFALGSLRGETAVIHFEKAATGYSGLYAAINKLVLEHAFPQVRYVNREEDMGIDGLRQAKIAYGPIRMISKFEARLNRKEG
jgi:hypothetical protein